MRSTSGSLVLVVGAVLLAGGFAAGYVVGSGGEPTAPPDVDPLKHALRPDAGPDRPGVRVEAVEEDPRLESARAAELEPLRRALEALPPPPVPRGTGVISGVVKTTDGEPVAGVRVTALPAMPRSLRGATRKAGAARDLPSSVLGHVNGFRWRMLTRQEIRTDTDGRYRFENLIDTAHHIYAQHEAWELRATAPNTREIKPGSTVDFVARPVTTVPVQVYLPDGTQPESATVIFQTSTTGQTGHWTPSQPTLRVGPGTWTVTARAGEKGAYRSKPITLVLERDGTNPEIRFDLAGQPIIRGRVLFPAGQRTVGTQVRVARIPKGKAATAALLGTGGESAHVSSREGRETTFTFDELKPGHYLLGVTRTLRGPVVATKEVELKEDSLEVDLEVPPLERKEYVVLRISGPDAKPLSDVEIHTGFRSDGGSSYGGSTTIDRDDSETWVLHHSHGYAKAGTYLIQVNHALYGTREIEYESGKASAFDLRFEEPGSLAVTVTGLVGTIYDGRVKVGLRLKSSTQRPFMNRPLQEPDGEGLVQVEGAQPGDYELVLHVTGSGHRRSEIGRQKVAVTAGTNRVRVPLPTLYEVTLEGLEGSAFLRAGTRGLGHVSVTAAADGRAVVDGLPAGRYTVFAGSKHVEFRLPGATTIRIE